MIDFALLGHPADYLHFSRLVDRNGTKGEKLQRHRALMEKMVEWAPSYAAPDPIAITLGDPRNPGAERTITGRMIVCPFLPDALTGPREMKRAYDKVRAGTSIADELGCRLGALGGFTSIIEAQMSPGERGGRTIFTSGNRLTAAFAVRQIEHAVALAGSTMADRRVAIVGATGDIGRIAAHLLVGRVRSLLLVARFRPRIEALATTLSRLDVTVSDDIAAVAQADTVLLAAGARSAIADESAFAPGSIICDVGFPKNVSYAAAPRRDIVVFSGGLAHLPHAADLQLYTRLPDPRLIFACYAEAITLAMHPDGAALAAQQGDAVDLSGVARVEAAAGAVGIRPAPLWRGDVALTSEAFALERRSA